MRRDICQLCRVPYVRDLEVSAVVCVACDARVERATREQKSILLFKPQQRTVGTPSPLSSVKKRKRNFVSQKAWDRPATGTGR